MFGPATDIADDYQRSAMKLTILCYHKVGPVAEEGRRLNIEPKRLASHVHLFRRRGFRFVQAGDLAARSWPERAVCLTFDDAYESALRNALPILIEAQATATFYAVTGLVGLQSQWDLELARPLAGWNLLAKARELGFEIGNHTCSHPRLDELLLEKQTREILVAREDLEKRGYAQRSFCYPYGAFDMSSQSALRTAGYEVAVALGKRAARPTDDRLELPRIVVAYSDAVPKLLYKIHIRPRLP